MTSSKHRLDEFESVFRSSVRPHVEFSPLPMERLLVILDVEGSPDKLRLVEDEAVHLAERFGSQVRMVAPVRSESAQADARKALTQIGQRLGAAAGAGGAVVSRSVTRVLLDELRTFQPSLLIMPTLMGHADEELESYTLGALCDRLLSESRQPVLLAVGGAQVDTLFADLLVYVESAQSAQACLDAAATLVSVGGKVTLLHVIDSNWLQTLHRGLELASEVRTETAEAAIVSSLKRDMTHYLEGAAAAFQRSQVEVAWAVEVGDPISVCRRYIHAGGHRLLICNSVAPDQKLIDSLAYNLAVYLREIPLALV